MTHDADTFHAMNQTIAERKLGTSLSWRSAHSWLRGYSDAKGGRENNPPVQTPDPDAYRRGYDVGSGVPVEPAYGTRGCGQECSCPE